MSTRRRLSFVGLAGLMSLLVLSVSTCRLDMLVKSGAGGVPLLSVSPMEVRDSARAGSDDIRRADVSITNGGDGSFTWSASKDKGWISLEPTSGTPPGTLTISLDGHGMAPGTYQGKVTIDAQGTEPGSAEIAVTFVVQRAGLVVLPGTITHSTNVNSDEVFRDELRISNTGNGVLVWTVRKSRPWITLGEVAGTGNGTVPVTIDSKGLRPGTYTDEIVVEAFGAEGSPARIPVTLNVFEPGLAVTPASIRDSAAVGSTVPLTDTLRVTNSGTGTITWTAAKSEPWVSLSKVAGGAPDSVIVTLSPTGLVAGTYRDTILFTSPQTTEPLEVPVRLVIQRPCNEIVLALDEVRTGTLAPPDCEAPHRPGSLANVYRVAANAGDTLSVRLTAAFNAYLILTDGAGATVLAQNDECFPETGTACIKDFPVSATGPYLIEATSAGPGETGALTISVVRERPPPAPQAMSQFHKGGTTPIAIGATTAEDEVVLRGRISDPNDADSVRLEIELEPLGSPFTNAPTHQSAFVLAGSGSVTVSVPVGGLTNNTGYHWQARTCDRTGRCSAWLAFGGNDETSPDFTVQIGGPPPPPPPGAPPAPPPNEGAQR